MKRPYHQKALKKFISRAAELWNLNPSEENRQYAGVYLTYARLIYEEQKVERTASVKDLESLNELEESLNFPLTEISINGQHKR